MLLFREKIPETWWEKIRPRLNEVLVDHAHLERKAATTALSLERYHELHTRVGELNAIAIEELEHFQAVLNLLSKRGVAFRGGITSPWISGLMRKVRKGRRLQVIDHLICCALIEGRSCEKFQFLAEQVKPLDPELASFYGSLVESEGNHYATYILMARDIDEAETSARLDYFLDVEAELMRVPHELPILH